MSGKRSASNVLIEDPDCPFRDSDNDLLDEVDETIMENPLVLPLYYQVGSGFEAYSSSVRGPVFMAGSEERSIDEAIVLVEKSRRRNHKYQAEEYTFHGSVDIERLPQDTQGIPIIRIPDTVRELFEQLIRRTTGDLNPSDLIRFCIQAEGLDKPISTSLMTVSILTVEKIFSAVMKVLQSKDKIELDTGFAVDVITIGRPVGAGGNRRVINISMDRLRKQSILSIPYDDEGLCCAKAIIYALAHLNKDKTAIKAMKDRRRPALMKRAKELHRAANVPLGPCTFAEIAIFEDHLDTQIAIFSSENLNQVVYKGKERPRRINLWVHDGHYDVIKSIKGFFGSNHYCITCEKTYDHPENHRCPNACPICLRTDCKLDQTQRCQDCDRLCRSDACYAAHKALTGNQKFSLCDKVYQCRECCQMIRRRDCPKELHKCGTTKCPSCNQFVVATEHRCYLRRVAPKKPDERLIFFDFETDQSSGEHLVNFAVAQYADGTERVFPGYTSCQDFCAWLFTTQHKGYTAVAHNMKGFDGQFVMAWLLKQGTAPEVIPNGSMIMCLIHPSLNIRVIDSLNFLPMALAELPGCFGLSELRKGYFPHLFNSRENQNYVGPLPEAQYYSPDTMSTSARQAFMSWHEEHKRDVFNFQEEMLAYCRSDVDILRRCCLEFRAQFLDVAGVDPFQYVTIASACMATYRSGHIQPDTIAMVPTHGYINSTKYSPDSIRWLDFIAASEGIAIQHALNGSGEHRIAGISVDGFCEETQTVYQFQGCFFHGCSLCYDGDVIHPLKGVFMAVLKKKTEETTRKLRAQGLNVIEMWEHEFQRQKEENPDLQAFLDQHYLKDRLNPRDSFFGGRTDAVKLYHQGDSKYVDFNSLYPWVNKYSVYPLGHPEVITESFGDVEEYFGFIQCRVIPPRNLYLPVLPYRCRKKLMFPLCRTCALLQLQAPCTHTDDERALVGTWVSEEVKLAKKKGYRVTHIYEVYHFPATSTSLFRSYIDLFLKIKQESSGWPAECVTEEDRLKYIRQYEEREGVRLDAEKISKNPGRRQVAKLALNSFWGRWGMNVNKGQLTYIHTVPDFNKMLADSTKKIKDVFLPTPEVAAFHWESAKEFVPQDVSTNIFLATFTTAWARLKLYSEMEKLGRDVLYHDTDSIIYASNSRNDPPLGNFLGEFRDELDGDIITTFVSGGPKNYAYQTATGKTCCKVRGFSLNFRNSQLLNFEAIRSLVCSLDRNDIIPLHNPCKITREAKRRKVVNIPETKLYRMVVDKRVIQKDLSTLPYGY